ncbi:ABC transporter ATP-binding protein [Streptococcus acidominimus]|uniref:ABC-type quaternary amine transporter n=1 Tax=Streptococcus acidominimus TaxID=1326 RepID=A0A1Q8EDL6_STRAI|nr:ABC transporter ATP-binding protein [Streptococcus acidominimus]MBF0846427.1 ABC transporter ATP-binding protein [Streptococcus danieliae]MBF0819272.1 ABC transporter ATP-binding protein [Streptococcus acidominimus]MBF0838448.1 ABC transporter ATP-binding protein [Streptococcus acidominimus]OLF49891.1 ABC transporter ATP-binding protein [Streptococcus acidominimus]TFU30124.1 ABC transporter ATP-binding protein [Streptococcus acidominimus]
MSYIQVNQLVKKFNGKEVLKSLDLRIQEKTITTLLGPSGCGKSTLLRSIVGLHPIEGGEIIIDGKRVDQLPPNERKIGMVFQNYALFPNMTVQDNIRFGLDMKKIDKQEANASVQEMIQLVGLEGKETALPRELSGGQQQRVALARALVTKPKVLLLDEPLSALDAQIRKSIQKLLRRLQYELGITMILVTHDQEEAMALSDYIYILKDGCIAQEGEPNDIYKHPKSEFIAKFIGSYNLLNAEAFYDIFKSPLQGASFVAIRPEIFSPDPLADAYQVEGEIMGSSMLGSIVRYDIKIGNQMIYLDRLNRSYQQLDTDNKILLYVKEEDMVKI